MSTLRISRFGKLGGSCLLVTGMGSIWLAATLTRSAGAEPPTATPSGALGMTAQRTAATDGAELAPAPSLADLGSRSELVANGEPNAADTDEAAWLRRRLEGEKLQLEHRARAHAELEHALTQTTSMTAAEFATLSTREASMKQKLLAQAARVDDLTQRISELEPSEEGP